MKLFISAILTIICFSCSDITKKTDFVEIPFFEIELELSEMAEKILLADEESIIVTAYFESYLYNIEENKIKNIPKKYIDEHMGEIHLLYHNIELTDKRLARFEHLKIPKYLYDTLEEKNIYVVINVYSGRRSSNLNILDCAVLIGPIGEIKEKKFTLNGGLISEGIKRNHINLK